jgi:hypothetical protein
MIPEDQQRVILAILTSIPLSLILKQLPSFASRKYYTLILASILQYYVYGNEVLLSYALHVLIYAIIVIKGR